MDSQTFLAERKNLNLFQKLRKKQLLRHLKTNNGSKYVRKIPDYLMDDMDVLSSASMLSSSFFMKLPMEKKKALTEINPNIFFALGYFEQNNIMNEMPEYISNIFDQLSSEQKEYAIRCHEELFKKMSAEEQIKYIALNNSKYDGFDEDSSIVRLIKYMTVENQIKLLTNHFSFQDENTNEFMKTHDITPQSFWYVLNFFNPEAVEKSVPLLFEQAKMAKKEPFEYFFKMDIKNLPVKTQHKIGALDKSFWRKMSEEALLSFVGDNALVFKVLDANLQAKVLKQHPEFYDLLTNNEKTHIEEIDASFIKESNYSYSQMKDIPTIKNEIISRESFPPHLLSKIHNVDVMLEAVKFAPELLMEEENKKEMIMKYCEETINDKEIVDVINDSIRMGSDVNDRNSFIVKFMTNDNIMNKADKESLVDFFRDPNMEKAKKILVNVYGDYLKEVFEQREGLDIRQIRNLDILSPEVYENMGLDAICMMLSYNDKNVQFIVGELARNPEYMQEFQVFTKITEGYYNDTPVDLKRRLLNYYELKGLFVDTKIEDFTEDRIANLVTMINDKNMTDNKNETDFIPVETLEDVDQYMQRRNAMYDDYLKKVSSPEEIKEAIFRKFFGVRYEEGTSFVYSQRSITVREMLYHYNLKNFIDDERTQNSELFTQEELDQLELITIIDKIQDCDTLKELYQMLSENQKEVVMPSDFKSIREKIPNQYSKELVESLLTVDDAKQRAMNGEEGISYSQTEDGFEIISMTGADFKILLHVTDFMEDSERGVGEIQERWKNQEVGRSTISCSVIESGMLRSCAYWGKDGLWNNIILGFSNYPYQQIIGMSYTDAQVSHGNNMIDPAFLFGNTMFDYPEELVRKTAANVNGQIEPELKDWAHPYNEVTMYRRSLVEDSANRINKNERIMPDYIVVYGEVNEYHKIMAKEFSDTDTPLPIIRIDIDAYKDRIRDRGLKKEDYSKKRERTPFMTKVDKKIIELDER